MGNIIRDDAPQSVLEAEDLRLLGRVLVLANHALGLQLVELFELAQRWLVRNAHLD